MQSQNQKLLRHICISRFGHKFGTTLREKNKKNTKVIFKSTDKVIRAKKQKINKTHKLQVNNLITRETQGRVDAEKARQQKGD